MATTIGETGTMGETVVGEEGGEGAVVVVVVVVVITEVGTIDRRTGTWIATTGGRCPRGDICGVDEADRGALHREVPGMGIFHRGINVPGVLLVNSRRPHNRPQCSHEGRTRTSLGGISDPVRLTPNQLRARQPNPRSLSHR